MRKLIHTLVLSLGIAHADAKEPTEKLIPAPQVEEKRGQTAITLKELLTTAKDGQECWRVLPEKRQELACPELGGVRWVIGKAPPGEMRCFMVESKEWTEDYCKPVLEILDADAPCGPDHPPGCSCKCCLEQLVLQPPPLADPAPQR